MMKASVDHLHHLSTLTPPLMLLRKTFTRSLLTTSQEKDISALILILFRLLLQTSLNSFRQHGE